MRSARSAVWAAIPLAAALVAGCTGSVDGGGGEPPTAASTPRDAAGPAATGSSTAPAGESGPGPRCTSVEDCLSQMTLDDKIGQMTQASHQALAAPSDIETYRLGSLLSGGGGRPAAGNEPEDWADMVDAYQEQALSTPLGIPLLYGADGVHGHSNAHGATIFPHNIGIGATRNPELAEQVGRITALEMSATGIWWNFSPCLCVARDERWGRTYESYGEDPEIGVMMTRYISGMQGEDLSAPDTVMATAKHWVGDGGTEGGQDQGDAQISEEELRAIHVPPFAAAVERGVGAVMGSFSSWNGAKVHGSEYLLTDVLRGELGFDGFVISDWAAVDQVSPDYAEAVRTAINAGVDMVMVPNEYPRFIETLRAEVDAGKVSMERIDEAARRILEAKFALGLFDRPFADRSRLADVGSAEHREVARAAVRESLVLLRNDGVLPLSTDAGSILVAGKAADDIGNQSGGWTITWQGESGAITPGTTVLEAVQEAAGVGAEVVHSPRADGELSADVGIVVVGERPYAEFEGDRDDLSLDAADQEVIERVCGAMPCVVVLISGRPMIVTDVIESTNAFVAAWLPGTEGAGIADVLFGEHDFTGTLPVSWPRSMEQVPINIGDPDYDPLFEFGFGLTYAD